MGKSVCLIMALVVLATGCSSTKVAKDFSGLSTTAGKPIAHVSTSKIAVHLMFGKEPLWGDASLPTTVANFTAAAKEEGGNKVRIVQSSCSAWWFLFPPITFIITPVFSNVAGDVVE